MNTLLSKTERQILNMRISGDSRKEIASKMYRSELTVNTHFQNMNKKTNSKDEIDLVIWFLRVEKGLLILCALIVIVTYSGIDVLSILKQLTNTITSALFIYGK